ncbi:gag/pol/env polyprotein, putative, partial [Perkinsus marinus ATCC 50983]
GLTLDMFYSHALLAFFGDALRIIGGRSPLDWDSTISLTDAENSAVSSCCDLIADLLQGSCHHDPVYSEELQFNITSDASQFGYGWSITENNSPQFGYQRARLWKRSELHWHINRRELYALCDSATFMLDIVDSVLKSGKKCSILFNVDSQTTARWVATNKSSCRTLEKHAVARLIGIFSEITHHWRDIGVTYKVELIRGHDNMVSDMLSRLAQRYDLVSVIYGDAFDEGWVDESCFVPTTTLRTNSIAPTDSPLLAVNEDLVDDSVNDYTELYINLLIVRAFHAWKVSTGKMENYSEMLSVCNMKAREWLKSYQRSSLSLRPLFKQVLDEHHPQDRYLGRKRCTGHFYQLSEDGLLVELRYPFGDILAVPFRVIVLPTDDTSLLEQLVLRFHLKGGHTDSRHTRWRISRSFRWAGMRKDIQRVCRSCVRCQYIAASRRSKTISRRLDTSVREPWSILSTDILGPVRKDAHGFQYVLVTICHMSRFVVLAPLKRADAKEVIAALRIIWNWWGVPSQIRSDNGPCYKSLLYKRAMEADGIRVMYISRYSPWSNGLCERVMPSVKNYLKGLSKKEYRDWSSSLSTIVRRLNTKPLRDGSDQSPYSIIFGHHYHEEEERRFSYDDGHISLPNVDDEVITTEEVKSLQSQRALILQEVLHNREDREPNHGPDQVISRAVPSIGSKVIRVGSMAKGDQRVYTVTSVGKDGVTVNIVSPDGVTTREHGSNLRRFWGANC